MGTLLMYWLLKIRACYGGYVVAIRVSITDGWLQSITHTSGAVLEEYHLVSWSLCSITTWNYETISQSLNHTLLRQ